MYLIAHSQEIMLSRVAGNLSTVSLSEILETVGYHVLDNAFGEFSDQLLEDILALKAMDMLTLSGNVVAINENEDNSNLLPIRKEPVQKPSVWEFDMVTDGEDRVSEHVWNAAPGLQALREASSLLVHLFNEAHPALCLRELDQFKIQVNTGDGGCFPMHFDTGLHHSRRHLTCVLYLNPEWTSESGGELRIYPLPLSPINLAPIHDRLVMFCSTQMLHRVCPSFKERVCVSLWFSAEEGAPPFPSRLPASLAHMSWERGVKEFVLQLLYDNESRRRWCKIIHSKEWSSSCREAWSAPHQKELVEAAIRTHEREVKRLEALIDPALLKTIKELLPVS